MQAHLLFPNQRRLEKILRAVPEKPQPIYTPPLKKPKTTDELKAAFMQHVLRYKATGQIDWDLFDLGDQRTILKEIPMVQDAMRDHLEEILTQAAKEGVHPYIIKMRSFYTQKGTRIAEEIRNLPIHTAESRLASAIAEAEKMATGTIRRGTLMVLNGVQKAMNTNKPYSRSLVIGRIKDLNDVKIYDGAVDLIRSRVLGLLADVGLD